MSERSIADEIDLTSHESAHEEVAPPKALAFYLPQFHPVAENDEWWGPGFTEWSNVVRAKSRFPGHRPRRLPTELGFYDLRVPETRQAQADLAAQHGVSGFIYWHYWFEGRRMLERPFEEVMRSGSPHFPFALGWANMSWTGVWTGQPRRTLIEQRYSLSDHERHANSLVEAFADPRYLKVDGRPLLYLFKPLDVPEPQRAFELWREVARRSGFPDLFIIGEAAKPTEALPILKFCDQTAPLHWSDVFGHAEHLGKFGSPLPHIARLSTVAKRLPSGGAVPSLEAPVVLAGWDNTPRRSRRGAVLVGDLPSSLRLQLEKACTRAQRTESKLVLLKSWNEWAEGNILEPCGQYGRTLLGVVDSVLAGFGVEKLSVRTAKDQVVTG